MSLEPQRPMGRSPADIVARAIDDNKKHLLLAASGSVATIKLPLIISAFSQHTDVSIRIILTNNAARFLAGQSAEQPTVESLATLPNVDSVHLDEDEWNPSWKRNSSILHIELRRWAHLLAVVPTSANMLAKITHGICDDLLTSTIRAWDVSRRIMVCPAMNSMMWHHPATKKAIAVLTDEWGIESSQSTGWFEVISPQSKALACGDVGDGAMRDWNEIVVIIKEHLGLPV